MKLLGLLFALCLPLILADPLSLRGAVDDALATLKQVDLDVVNFVEDTVHHASLAPEALHEQFQKLIDHIGKHVEEASEGVSSISESSLFLAPVRLSESLFDDLTKAISPGASPDSLQKALSELIPSIISELHLEEVSRPLEVVQATFDSAVSSPFKVLQETIGVDENKLESTLVDPIKNVAEAATTPLHGLVKALPVNVAIGPLRIATKAA